jgi:hypothetical protein
LQPGQLSISEASYLFISHLPVKESLSIHGKRLNITSTHQRSVEYSPSKKLTVNVKEGGLAMDVRLLDVEEEEEEDLILSQGEIKKFVLRLKNIGAVDVGELWMTVDDTVLIAVDDRNSITDG